MTPWMILLLTGIGAGCVSAYDTIVIGLGSAGCTATSTLAQAGKSVLALEAQGRIGGRVHTVPFGDGVVELGAEWIYGTYPSRVYDAAMNNKVDIINQTQDFEMFKSDGTMGDKNLFGELMDFAWEVMDDPPPSPEPLGQYISRRVLDHIKVKYPQISNDTEYIDSLLFFMDKAVGNLEACYNWNELSTKTDYEDIEGALYASWHRHGYKTFFEILLNTYKNGTGYPNLEIQLNKEVSMISWPQDPAQDVTVSCTDGTQYEARNVIITVSLGVLKEKYSTLFSPALPSEKVTAIDNISMGLLSKVILSFEEAWWSANIINSAFLWTLKDRKEIPKEDLWTTKITGPSYGMGTSNTLTLWTSGDAAITAESLPEDVVKSKTMKLVRRFMGKNISIPEPTAMLRSSWHLNPYTRGSYTFDNLLIPQYPNSRVNLGQPLVDSAGNARLLFAGEATNPKHFATVHGASETGYREALRLLSV